MSHSGGPAAAATIEELVITNVMTATISATGTIPLFSAMFPMRIAQFHIDYYGSNITADDTNYWSVALVKRSAVGGTTATIATKTTQTIPTGGEALSFHVPWVFDAAPFDAANQLFDNRDMLEIVFTKNGTASNITTPAVFVTRYEPL